jgi:hypothetical protein
MNWTSYRERLYIWCAIFKMFAFCMRGLKLYTSSFHRRVESFKMEQKVAIKFCIELKKTCTETLKMLKIFTVKNVYLEKKSV